MSLIFKGDNTAAFGNNFITINIDNKNHYEISRAVFVCGCIKKSFENPVFPLVVNFSSEESAKLNFKNVCYLVVYDSQGRQQTCIGSFTFGAQSGVI